MDSGKKSGFFFSSRRRGSEKLDAAACLWRGSLVHAKDKPRTSSGRGRKDEDWRPEVCCHSGAGRQSRKSAQLGFRQSARDLNLLAIRDQLAELVMRLVPRGRDVGPVLPPLDALHVDLRVPPDHCLPPGSIIGNFFCKILQFFGGLVLGCIKTKFCKKICV